MKPYKIISLVGILLMGAGFAVVVLWPGAFETLLQWNSDTEKPIDLGDILQGSGLIDSDGWAEIRLRDTNGNILALSDLRGNIVFLNFWATWCPSCVSEMADMQTLYQKLKDKPFAMVAINIREPLAHVKHFLETQSLTFTTLLDPDGVTLDQFGIRALPTTLILDKSGRLIETVIGPRNWSSRSSLAKFKYLISQSTDES